jgi:hypothetical protein
MFQVTNGGAEGIQTPDPLIANQMLYQLSYSPTREDCVCEGRKIEQLPF